MTQEEKQILIADICARLPYGLMVEGTFAEMDCDTGNVKFKTEKKLLGMGDLNWLFHDVAEIKPYLRPMSSMTKKERKELECIISDSSSNIKILECTLMCIILSIGSLNWLYEHHFDIHGWIKKGLALEAPEGMYNF